MKRKDIGTVVNALNSVSELKGVKFAFAVLKNRKKVETQAEEDRPIFEEILKPSEGFKEYEEKRISLCELHSEKDENGKAVTENEKYKILDIKLFDKELQELTEEYKESVDERKSQIEEYNSLMEEDIEIDFVKLGIDDLPNDLSEIQLRSIEFMLDIAL